MNRTKRTFMSNVTQTKNKKVARFFSPRDAPPLKGCVESIGYGIMPQTGNREGLLPSVEPTLAWVRLAQRFPVRITLDDPPENHPLLRVGATATVIINEL